MSIANDFASGLGMFGVCLFYVVPWAIGFMIAWRAMRALERIAVALEIRPPAQP